jgi:selenide,water dikinase
VLNDILSKLPPQAANPALLIGHETGDDAAVFKINDEQAVVATTDFFMPIVDDPYDYGRIAATNALSDVYAVGGTPIMALAIAAMPMNQMPPDMVQKILSGGAQVCADAGVPVAGGHTIDAVEPIYGLAVVGLVHPDRIKRNCEANAGDDLVLGKALGVGILGAAMNKDELDSEGYRQMVDTATKLNAVGAELAKLQGVHALTDVTGFGLVGHLFEICQGSNVTAKVDWNELPILPAATDYAERGYNTGAAGRNWQSFGQNVTLPDNLSDWQKNILADPQTSGGLMLSCAPERTNDVLELFRENGFADVTVIGKMGDGAPHVTVTI